VIVLDANILLYAYDAASDQHTKARAWLEQTLSGAGPVGLPWQTLTAFVRIVTNPRLSGKRFTVAEVIEVVDQWIEQPNVRLLGPGDHHWSFLRQMIIDGQARGPLITDAQLAALTIEYGGVLYTSDRDFSRFPGLRWQNPIA
jgi:toxin-antitoxin system PIN domain toxin